MISPEQTQQIKQQLLQQIESFPEDKRKSAKQQIESMNEEQLEQFLIQNNLIKSQEGKQECIFCSIIQGKIPSYQIDSNADAIAALEINPISKGHVIIIPKKHIESEDKLPKTLQTLAEKIKKRITAKLKPKNIKIFSSNFMGHGILNILPIYKDETEKSERKKAEESELLELQTKLEKKIKPETIKKPKTQKLKKPEIEKLWLPVRIP